MRKVYLIAFPICRSEIYEVVPAATIISLLSKSDAEAAKADGLIGHDYFRSQVFEKWLAT